MQQKKSWVERIISVIVVFLFGLFSFWFIKQETADFFPTVFSMASIIVFSIIIKKITMPLESFLFLDKDNFVKTFMPVYDNNKNIIIITIGSFFWLLTLNIIIFLVLKYNYPLNSLSNALETHFSFFLDTKKNIFIAEDWYSNLGNEQSNYFFIFPLFPLVLKFLNLLNNFSITGIIISTICASLSGIILYKIVLFDYDEKTSLIAVKFYFIFPSVFFLVLPLSDSLLLLLSLLYVFLVRKREWLLSFFIGFFAGLTSPFALSLIVFSVFEFIYMVRENYLDKKYYGEIDLNNEAIKLITYDNGIKDIIPTIFKGFSILGIPTAFLVYLIINKDFYLNSVKIILYFKDFVKKEHTYFFSQAFYFVYNILSNDKSTDLSIFGIYVPNLFIFIFVLVVMYFSSKKIRSSYYIYSIVYFLIIFSLADLASAPRLSLLMFPIYIMLATLSKDMIVLDILLTFISLCAMVVYLLLFLLNYPIY